MKYRVIRPIPATSKDYVEFPRRPVLTTEQMLKLLRHKSAAVTLR